MGPALNAEDFRRRARRILPRGLFEYIDRGTEDEHALVAIRRSLDRLTLTPSILTGETAVALGVEVLGRPCAAPLAIAPTALAGLVAHDGEVKLARAAGRLGLPFTLSTQSIASIERLRAGAPDTDIWFQLYVWRDRELTRALLQRIRAAGCTTLVLTVDTQRAPKREYNQRNGFGLPFRPGLRNIADALAHPAWSAGVIGRYLLRGGLPVHGHYPARLRSSVTAAPAADEVQLETALSWADLQALRASWPGRLIVKGVLSVPDAQACRQAGADAIVVSAHGGRNLDVLPAPADVLGEIADAVGEGLAVFADSGVRRGTDALKYLALGAQMVLIGRLPLWGLAAGGERGAEAVLRMLIEEMQTAMGFLGCARPAALAGRIN